MVGRVSQRPKHGPRGRKRSSLDADFEEAEVESPPQLDLHGLPPDRALERLRLFLHASRVAGASSSIVITGAGHSNATGEPILRSRIEAWLAGTSGQAFGVRHVERTAKGGALAIHFK